MSEYASSACFIMQTERSCADGFQPCPVKSLYDFLNRGLDVSRSLWDRNSLIAHLDVEYVNFDFPAEPYLDPQRTFVLQKPVENAIKEILAEYGISPLHLITGRGHHFVWGIYQNTPAFERLKTIGHLPKHLQKYYTQHRAPTGEVISPDLGAAFSGLSLVMEYLVHRIQKATHGKCRIPVQLTEVMVPPQERGKEIISLDITEYGDPLNTRIIRIPFSLYLKPWYKKDVLNGNLTLPRMVVVPLHEMDVFRGIFVMRSLDDAAKLAQKTTAHVPDNSMPMEELTNAYQNSDLAAFHNHFFDQEQHGPDMWPATYDRFTLEALPPATRHILEKPMDLLLKPGCIRQVVRTLTEMGWHPRHIAGLIRSKYERNYGWGSEWYVYDAATRADFYVRVFSGAIAMGNDSIHHDGCE